MLLRDADIRSLLEGTPPLADPAGVTDDSQGSQVQPSSLDLTIGKICLPEVPEGERGSVEKPLDFHDLGPGQTAVLETEQTLALPNDVAAVGFPPDSVSSKGLLMTNPGHVDPGYRGPMKFTVINMGKKPYPLSKGKAVVTLLLFKLDRPAETGWLDRVGVAGRGATSEMLSHLSRDFLDLEARATAIAKGEVSGARLWTVLESLFATIVVIALTLGPVYIDLLNKVSDQRVEIAKLDSQQAQLLDGRARLEAQVSRLQTKVERLESTQP